MAVVVISKVMLQYLLGGTETNHEKCQRGYAIFVPKLFPVPPDKFLDMILIRLPSLPFTFFRFIFCNGPVIQRYRILVIGRAVMQTYNK